MVTRYLIDSSAASKYLEERFPENGLAFMDAIFDTESNISVIAKIELLTWNPAQFEVEEKVAIFVEDSTVYDLSKAIVDQTVQIRRKYRLKTPNAMKAVVISTLTEQNSIWLARQIRRASQKPEPCWYLPCCGLGQDHNFPALLAKIRE